MTSSLDPEPVSSWAAEMAELEAEDCGLPGGLSCLNLSLNRLRLAQFLDGFSEDADLRDLLLLDSLGIVADAPITSTGLVEDVAALALRPFRVWEYVWLFKALGLARGRFEVLDLGGPASHLVLLAALAGNRVTSVDINPEIVEAGRDCAQALGLSTLTPRVGDMRNLRDLPASGFDRIICCSVLEHLRVNDQKTALTEMARVLRPGGVIGLTFDYGPKAPGANIHLPPPHEPPRNPGDIRRRYVQKDLRILGNQEMEAPIPGGLFRDGSVQYSMASLVLGRPPLPTPDVPCAEKRRSSLLSLRAIPKLLYRSYRQALGRQRNAEVARRAQELERTAAERLEGLQAATEDANNIRAEAERRAEGLSELTAALQVHEQRIDELERTAAERLEALQAATAGANSIRAEAERREEALHELTAAIQARDQRLAELERTVAHPPPKARFRNLR
jgi:SAM-dependent methyltransferase